ncbi:MAG: hypothetical protein ACFFD1_14560 [Candidatus Thorarchaeota archaeon]
MISFIYKPCSDGVSMDVRPNIPLKKRINLKQIDFDIKSNFKSEIVTPQLAILYYLDPTPIKVTLYNSGRMLIDNRNEEKVLTIIKDINTIFSNNNIKLE